MSDTNATPDATPQPKLKVTLSPEVRAQFDAALERGDKAEFDAMSKAVAAIAAGGGHPAGATEIHHQPTPQALALAAKIHGVSLLLGHVGVPLPLRPMDDRQPAGPGPMADLSELLFQLWHEVPGRLEIHGPLNLVELGLPVGMLEAEYARRMWRLMHPRRWWLLGLRLPGRWLKEVRWSEQHGCWEALFGGKFSWHPLTLRFTCFTFKPEPRWARGTKTAKPKPPAPADPALDAGKA